MRNLIFVATLSFAVLLGIWWIRHGRLYEKYVAFWLMICLGIFSLGMIPGLVGDLSDSLGFTIPSNFIFALACLTLLVICFHLSQDVTKLRRQVEELAIESALNRESNSQR